MQVPNDLNVFVLKTFYAFPCFHVLIDENVPKCDTMYVLSFVFPQNAGSSTPHIVQVVVVGMIIDTSWMEVDQSPIHQETRLPARQQQSFREATRFI